MHLCQNLLLFLLTLSFLIQPSNQLENLLQNTTKIGPSWSGLANGNYIVDKCGCTAAQGCNWVNSYSVCNNQGTSFYVDDPDFYVSDDVIDDSSDIGALCTAFNTTVEPVNKISYIFDNIGTVSARTIMSVWTESSVSASNFQTATQTVTFKLGSTNLATQFTATGSNYVWTTANNETITFDYLKTQVGYNSLVVGEQVSLCLDTFFALRQYYLNPFIKSTQLQYYNGSYFSSQTELNQFNQNFTQGPNCPATYYPPSGSTRITLYGSFQNSDTDPTGSVIMTSILTQFGSDHPNNSQNQYYSWKYTSGQWIQQQNPATSVLKSNNFYAFTSVQIVGKIENYISTGSSTSTLKEQVCSVQSFGWPFCKVTDVNLTSSLITTMLVNPNDSIQFTSQFTAYYDPDKLLVNNPFCSLTLQVVIEINGISKTISFPVNSTLQFDSQVFTLTLNGITQILTAALDPLTLAVTFTYSGSILSTTSGSHIISIKAVDSRDTLAKAVQAVNSLTVNFACDLTGLQTGALKFTSSQITNNQTFAYIKGYSNFGVVNFTVTEPTCKGYTGFLSQPSFVQSSTSVNFTMNTNVTTYLTCQTSTIQDICFFWDDATLSLQYFSNYGSNDTYFFEVFLLFYGQDKSLTSKTYQTQTLSVVIQTTNYACDQTSLGFGVLEFQDSSIVNNQIFTYIVGQGDSGIVNFKTTVPQCRTYVGFQSQVSFIQQSLPVNNTVNSNANTFTTCKTSMSQEICFYWDETTSFLQYFSNYGSNNTFYVQVYLIFTGTDKTGVTIAYQTQTLSVVIQTINYVCDQVSLRIGTFQFTNSSVINNQTFPYYIGVKDFGVVNFTTTIPQCQGYTGFQTKASFIQQSSLVNTTINTSLDIYKTCQNSTTSNICFYWDDSTQSLQYFSNYGQNNTFFVQIYLVFTSIDKYGATITQETSPLSIVVQTIDFACRTTSFTYKVLQNQQNYEQGLNLFVSRPQDQYQLFFINSCNSTKPSCDGTQNCGPLHFNLSANSTDPNRQLAKNLLNSDQNMKVAASQDGYSLILTFPLLNPAYSGVNLVFQLATGLQMFQNTFQVLDPVQNFQINVTILEFHPTISNMTVQYYVGQSNNKIVLPPYVIRPSSYNITSLTATQVAGDLIPIFQFQTDAASLTFQIKNETGIRSTQVIFQLSATLNNPQKSSNTDLNLTIIFVAASPVASIPKQNTPPYFIQPLISPDVIPCQDQNSYSNWKYDFSKSQDDEQNTIQFQLSCKEINSGLFAVSQSGENTYSLTLNRLSKTDTMPKSISCVVQLSDNLQAIKKYSLSFVSKCDQDEVSGYIRPLNKTQRKHKQTKPTFIEQIRQQQQVAINWETPMMIPQMSDQFLRKRNQTSTANLRNLQQKSCWDICPVTAILIPGARSSKSKETNLTISVANYTEDQTYFSINFSNPLAVSVGKQPDQIQLTILNVECFKNSDGQVAVKQGQNYATKISRQNSPGVWKVPVDSIQSTVDSAVTTTSILMLISNFIKNGIINQFLSVISSLAIILHMFLVALNYPQQLMEFFGLIFPLITFDAVPSELLDPINNYMFQFKDQKDSALTDQFDQVGYVSIFVVANIGSMFFLICFTITQWTSIGLLNCILNKTSCSKKNSKVKKSKCRTCIESTAKNHQWTGIFSFFKDGYLVLAVVAFIESNDLRFGSDYNFTENFNSSLAALLIFVVIVFPGFIACFYFYKLRHLQNDKYDLKILKQRIKQKIEYQQDIQLALKLEDESFKNFREKYGVFLEGVRINRLHYATASFTRIFELVFQLLVAVSLTRLVSYPVFVIFQFNFNILFNVSFVIYFMPYEENQENYLTIINYLTYLALNYHLFLFTAFVDQSMYFLVANSVIYLVWGSVTVNAFFALNNIVGTCLSKLKLIYARWVHRGRKPPLQILKQKIANMISKLKTKQDQKLQSILKRPKEIDCNEILDKQQKRVTFVNELSKKVQPTKYSSVNSKQISQSTVSDFSGHSQQIQQLKKSESRQNKQSKYHLEEQSSQILEIDQTESFTVISIADHEKYVNQLRENYEQTQAVVKSDTFNYNGSRNKVGYQSQIQTIVWQDKTQQSAEKLLSGFDTKQSASKDLQKEWRLNLQQDAQTKEDMLQKEDAKYTQQMMELSMRKEFRDEIIVCTHQIVVCPWDATKEGYREDTGLFVITGARKISSASE